MGDLGLAFTNGILDHIPADEQGDAVAYRASLGPHGLLALRENSPYNPATRYGVRANDFDQDAVMVRPLCARGIVRANGMRVPRADFVFAFPRALARLGVLEPPPEQVAHRRAVLVLAQRT